MFLNKEALVLKYVKTKQPKLKDSIAASYKPLVEYIARKLTFNKQELDDIVQVGNIGLLRALERFDPSMDTDFSTFATPNIIGEIKHYFRDKRNIVKIPRKLQETHSKIKRFIKENTTDGRQPTPAVIAKNLEITEEIVLECFEASKSTSIVSLDNSGSGRNSFKDSGNYALIDSIGEEHKEDFYLSKISLGRAMKSLNDREKKIIYLRYYKGLSQTEIAEILDLSQMHISRLLNKSIDKLRKNFP